LEQKETKETKNASHRIECHIYQYQFVKVIFRPALAGIGRKNPNDRVIKTTGGVPARPEFRVALE